MRNLMKKLLRLFGGIMLISMLSTVCIAPCAARTDRVSSGTDASLSNFQVLVTFDNGLKVHPADEVVTIIVTVFAKDAIEYNADYDISVHLNLEPANCWSGDWKELYQNGQSFCYSEVEDSLPEYHAEYSHNCRFNTYYQLHTDGFACPMDQVRITAQATLIKYLDDEHDTWESATVLDTEALRFGDVCDSFEDIDRNSWYHGGVDFALCRGIYRGVSENMFDPDGTMTRAMLVTALWRMAGMPAPTISRTAFLDVKAGAYYETALCWAVGRNIIKGVTETSFAPDDPVTREQLAVILWRFSSLKYNCHFFYHGATSGAITDFDTVSAYAQTAVLWANNAHVLVGMGNGQFCPKQYASRAQVAVILMRHWIIENLLTIERYELY